MLIYIGVDLAWKMAPDPDEKRTALVSLDEEGTVLEYRECSGDNEIVEACLRMGPGECTLGIDAPLVVPAETVRIRDCELALMRMGIRVFPTNPTRFQRWYGGCRGVAILEKLRALGYGYELVAELPSRAQRAVVEVYPTASWMKIFGERPRFKNVPLSVKRDALMRLHEMLEDRLPSGYPRVELGPLRHERNEIKAMSGAQLDHHGDALDAVMAAYTVLLWRSDPSLCEVVGTLERGFIVVPKAPGTRDGERLDGKEREPRHRTSRPP
ncbi:MAG: DUF429 domain-containing protein [Thermoplasmata archaeon]